MGPWAHWPMPGATASVFPQGFFFLRKVFLFDYKPGATESVFPQGLFFPRNVWFFSRRGAFFSQFCILNTNLNLPPDGSYGSTDFRFPMIARGIVPIFEMYLICLSISCHMLHILHMPNMSHMSNIFHMCHMSHMPIHPMPYMLHMQHRRGSPWAHGPMGPRAHGPMGPWAMGHGP